jgi:hypothetical protein
MGKTSIVDNLERIVQIIEFVDKGQGKATAESLLDEIVAIKGNYKNVKECAELAKRLDLRTPSARALAACASSALHREDMFTVKVYVQQLAKTARNFTVIYEMAKRILTRDLDDQEV